MIKLALAVMALIIAALVAGAYFDFNPALAIFVILGFGVYGVGRIGGPPLPGGYQIGLGGHGIYLEPKDFVPPDLGLAQRPPFPRWR